MSAYAVSLDCPHATRPDVLWRVIVRDVTRGGDVVTFDADGNQSRLWVPLLDTWTLDTLRMVLHELAAFLPAHSAEDAQVRIFAKPRRRGRRSQTAAPPVRLESAELMVSANGWSAEVWTSENTRGRRKDEPEHACISPGEWSEPMAATLLDLAAKSPFPLMHVGDVEPAIGADANLVPSRREVLRYGRADGQRRRGKNTLSTIIQSLRTLRDDIQDIKDDLDDQAGSGG